MTELIQTLRRPWSDQVKGSWWKAPIIIIIYFYLRTLAELWVLQRGIDQVGQQSLALNDSVFDIIAGAEWEYFLQALGLTLLVIVVCYLLGFRFFDFKSFNLKRILKTIAYFFLVYIIQIVMNVVIRVNVPDYSQPANQAAVVELINSMTTFLIFLNIVIFTPIIEEYLLRGLIMKYTFSLMPFTGAVVASVTFTLLHMPNNPVDFLIYFILSSGITFLYWYTRRLEYPILFHIIQNLIGFIGILLL